MRKDKLAVCHRASTPETDVHQTPKPFFEYIQKKLGISGAITIDIAASKQNSLCKKYIDKKQNALKSTWKGIAWCNPPYSLAKEFVEHCLVNAEEGHGSTVILIAARTDRAWWALTQFAYRVIYIQGRLKFVGAKAGAPFPSAVIVFKKGYKGPPKHMYLCPTPYERGFSRGKPN